MTKLAANDDLVDQMIKDAADKIIQPRDILFKIRRELDNLENRKASMIADTLQNVISELQDILDKH